MEGLGILWSIIIGIAAGAIAGWINEAYKKKYAGDEYLDDMVSETPKGATVKMTSFN